MKKSFSKLSVLLLIFVISVNILSGCSIVYKTLKNRLLNDDFFGVSSSSSGDSSLSLGNSSSYNNFPSSSKASSSSSKVSSSLVPTRGAVWQDFSIISFDYPKGTEINDTVGIFNIIRCKSNTSAGKTVTEGSRSDTTFTGAVQLPKNGSNTDKCISFIVPYECGILEIYANCGTTGIVSASLFVEINGNSNSLTCPNANIVCNTIEVTGGQEVILYAGANGTINVWGIAIFPGLSGNVGSSSSNASFSSSQGGGNSFSSSYQSSNSPFIPSVGSIWQDFSELATIEGKGTEITATESIFTITCGKASISSGKTVTEGSKAGTCFTGAVLLGKNGTPTDKCIAFMVPTGCATLEIYVDCATNGVTICGYIAEIDGAHNVLSCAYGSIACNTIEVTGGQEIVLYASDVGSIRIWGINIY